MAAVVWTPTQDALAAAIASPALLDDLTIALERYARLTGVGQAYDLTYGAGAEAAKAAVTTTFNTALAAWSPRALASHLQADRAARYCEQLQINAQAGTVPESSVFENEVLTPNVVLTWAPPSQTTSRKATVALDGVAASITGTRDMRTADLSLFNEVAGVTPVFEYTVTVNGVPDTQQIDFGASMGGNLTSADALISYMQAVLISHNVIAYLGANGRVVLVTSKASIGATVNLEVHFTPAAGASSALPLFGLVDGQNADALESSTVITAKNDGPIGNATTAQIKTSSSLNTQKFDLEVHLDGYAEVFRDIDPTGLGPLSGSKLLGPLFSLSAFGVPNARPDNHAAWTLSGGAGDSHALLEARITRALRFPAAADAGQTAILTEHKALLDILYAEEPQLEAWAFRTPIPTAGVSTLVPLTKDGAIDVYQLEVELLAEIDATNAWLAEFGFPF